MLVLQEENRKQERSPWQLPDCLSLSRYCREQSPGLQGLGSALSFLLSYVPRHPPPPKKNKTKPSVLLSSYLFQAAAEVPVDNLETALSRRAEN